MTGYFNDFFLSEQELAELKQSAQDFLQQRLQEKDRLRVAMQLYILTECCCNALTTELTADFVNSLQTEIAEAKQQVETDLSRLAQEQKEHLDSLCKKAEEIHNELHVKKNNIDEVINGVATTEDIHGTVDQHRDTVNSEINQIETLLQEYMRIRDGRAFDEMCRLISK